jgi:hypothetical protein
MAIDSAALPAGSSPQRACDTSRSFGVTFHAAGLLFLSSIRLMLLFMAGRSTAYERNIPDYRVRSPPDRYPCQGGGGRTL